MDEPKRRGVGIHDVTFGERVRVVEPANLYGCAIEDDCFIGPFVEVQKDVTIGRRCKVQSHSFICELVTIGDDCVVANAGADRVRSGRARKGNVNRKRAAADGYAQDFECPVAVRVQVELERVERAGV